MMALGSARPLQATDLWKLDEARSAGTQGPQLSAAFARRVKVAKEYNERLADSKTPLPWRTRVKFMFVSNRAKREHEYRTVSGRKKASLAWALNDVWGTFFWMGAVIKICGDALQATTPLLIKAILLWVTQSNAARADPTGATPYPLVGNAVGMAIGLFLMLLVSSLCLHHSFVRGMECGVLIRGSLISSIYDRALRLTQKSRGQIPNGKLVNHISTDTSRIDFASGLFIMTWTAIVQFAVVMIILLVQIGYSALPGIGFLMVATPLQTLAMKSLFKVRKKSMVWTDKRAKLLQEILGGMRIVKFMAWENPFLDRLQAIRGMELSYIRKLMISRSGMMGFAMSLPVLAAIISFITYSSTAHDLQAATIFTVVTLFQLMRMPLMIWPMALSATADAQNALSRLEVVFEAEVVSEHRLIDPSIEDGVRIDHASFTWDAAPIIAEEALIHIKGKYAKAITGSSAAATPTKKKEGLKWHKKRKSQVDLTRQANAEMSGGRPHIAEAGGHGMEVPPTDVQNDGHGAEPERIFQVRDVDLHIPRGSLTAIVGAIGSGKSSLLQGLMGEMRRTEGKVTFSGSTSLCAQSPWIQNATVRENILFGQPWDEERYWAAVRDSCLEPDLELLEDGDGTEIGEKGITLSGGQKQRVNIARAIYFNADIIALDDPLSALDAGVGRALFFNGIIGALSGKTRILVTHALHFLPHVDHIITMEDGRIAEQGSYNELREQKGAFYRLIRDFGAEDEDEDEFEKEASAIDGAVAGRAIVQKTHDRAKMVAKGNVHSLMQAEERNARRAQERHVFQLLQGGQWAYHDSSAPLGGVDGSIIHCHHIVLACLVAAVPMGPFEWVVHGYLCCARYRICAVTLLPGLHSSGDQLLCFQATTSQRHQASHVRSTSVLRYHSSRPYHEPIREGHRHDRQHSG